MDQWVKAIAEAIGQSIDTRGPMSNNSKFLINYLGSKHKTEVTLEDLGTIIAEDEIQISDESLGSTSTVVFRNFYF